MALIMTITGTTSDADLETIPFVDMRIHARERRDDMAAVMSDIGDDTALELHEYDGATVLWSPHYAYGYVNEDSPGVGDSLLIENDGANDIEHAVALYRTGRTWSKGDHQWITIEWDSGRPHKGSEDDEERAAAAAESVLNAAGMLDYGTAESEYRRQWLMLDDEAGMSGLALLWIKARDAANVALTEGWHNPDGAHWSIRAL